MGKQLAQRSLPDNFDFALWGAGTKAPFKGYISSVDPTVIGPDALIGGSQNAYKRISQDIFARPGLKRRGTADATLAGVTSSFDWETSLATLRPLRVVEDTATSLSKLQVESSIADGTTLVWYDLLTGQSNSRFVFDTWWDATNEKDTLLFVNGGATIGSWTGAMGIVLATTANTIQLTGQVAVLGFVGATGTVLVNGTSYAFTGVAGDTFTGVSPNPTGEANGSVVLDKPVINTPTNLPAIACEFIKVVENQAYVGSYSSYFIPVSKNTDFTLFTVPAVRVPGDPDLLTIGSLARGITVQKGSSSTAGNAVIAGGLGDWYTVRRNQITVGATLTEQVDVLQTKTADLSTALAHEFIDLIGDTIVFLDQNNQLREFGTVRDIVTPVFPLLSLDVFTELKHRDFTGGALRVVEDEGDTTVYITCPAEGIDYMYQVRESLTPVGNIQTERLWQPPQVRGLSRIAVLNGVTYGYSATNPQSYQLWETQQYFDDGPFDGDQIPYKVSMVFGYINLSRTLQMNFNKIYFEGHMTRGSVVSCNTYLEYQGSKNILNTVVNNPIAPNKKLAAFYGAQNNPSPGENALGNIEVGDGIIPPDLGSVPVPKFRAMRRIASQNVFEAALEVYSEDLDSEWGLLLLGINMQAANQQPTEIMA